MRRMLAVTGSVLLALALTAPIVGAANGDITGITVQSATVNKAGLVVIRGTMYCQNGIPWVDAQGAVTQAIGHKATVVGGFYGGAFNCLSNGPTYYEVAAYASPGTFANGWANVQISFGQTVCNDFGCYWDWYGGNDFYVKLTRA
jgi:hypothetical protein